MQNNTKLSTICNISAIVPSAGLGTRMHINYPKQYILIGNKTILEYSVSTLLANPNIIRIIIVIISDDINFFKLNLYKHPRITVIEGEFKRRIDSVLAGIKAAQDTQWVLIHDAVRPCLHKDDLEKIISVRNVSKIGGILATPIKNTIKLSLLDKKQSTLTIDRSNLWHALTPQFFYRELLYDCILKAIKDNIDITDEASALEYCGFYPELIEGRSDNIKITNKEDLLFAEFYLTSNFTNRM